MNMNKFNGHKTNGNDAIGRSEREVLMDGINLDYLERVDVLLSMASDLKENVEANYKLLEQQKMDIARQMDILKKTADEIRNYKVPEEVFADINERVRASVDNSLDAIAPKLKLVTDVMETAKGSIDKIVKESAQEAGEQVANNVRLSWYNFQKTINEFKTWCKQWQWRFISVAIWAILVSGFFIQECSSSNSEKKELLFQIDSIQLNSDIAWDYVEHEVSEKRWNQWLQKSRPKYEKRFQQLDSLRKNL